MLGPFASIPSSAMLRTRFTSCLILAASLALPASALGLGPVQKTAQGTVANPPATEQQILAECTIEKPTQLFPVTRVVDGDTIWIERDGKREKLRLLSVDTEEKFNPGNRNDPNAKPNTRYGDACASWTRGFFAPRSAAEAPVQIGLRFPNNREARDIYGRLLCHVVTDQGVDFNLLLVRRGMSPYFNKYGNSLIDSKAFQAAQAAAKKEKLGIWNPKTNQADTLRDYAGLIPWWQARADAVESFRKQANAKPMQFVEAENPDALAQALKFSLANDSHTVTVMGLVDRFFEEDNGSQTVLMRSGDKKRSLRVVIRAEDRKAMEKVDLAGSKEQFRQNYMLITGKLESGPRGPQILCTGAEAWRRAGPEPVTPGR